MEDEEEIQSHPSPSPSPSPPNGRITVTVAAVPPAQNTLTLALPIQQPKNNNGSGGGREDCWSEGATAVLIDAWGERYLELSRGNLKQKHWKEVADIVSSREDYSKTPKTDIQCKNRIDTVKKKYKLEKSKIAAGAGASKWPFFERLEELIGPTAKIGGSMPMAMSGALQKVPVGIPVGIRSANQFQSQQQLQVKHQPQMVKAQNRNRNQNQNQNQKMQLRKRGGPVDTESSGSEEASPDSTDSFPPEKRARVVQSVPIGPIGGRRKGKAREGGREKGWGNSVRELTQAVLKFGEAYEHAENAKLQQVVEMEKQRMKFATDMELQRMQFFIKTQLEISQIKHGRRGGSTNTTSNHHSNNNNNNNNSDTSN